MTSKNQIKSATPTLTLVALVLAGFAFLPQMQATAPCLPVDSTDPVEGCLAGFETAEGCHALCFNTGAGNTAMGWYSLTFSNATNFNTAYGAATLAINGTTAVAPQGDGNTAIGCAAMVLNDTG
jgi:hypothetical protein